MGHHRSNHITASKGKRSKKRKRQEAKNGNDDLKSTALPPPPEISPFVVVGLNSITRILESSSQKSRPLKSLNRVTSEDDETEEKSKASSPRKRKTLNTSENAGESTTHHPVDGHFSAIFVTRSSQPTILHAHLPQLVATASLAYPESSVTRLVQLPKGSDARVCEALGLPRVSFIGVLEGAPNSKSLVEVIRDFVPEIDIPWLQETKALKYLPVNINVIETFSSVSKEQKQP